MNLLPVLRSSNGTLPSVEELKNGPSEGTMRVRALRLQGGRLVFSWLMKTNRNKQ